LTAADPANDVIPIVDVSDTTMAASGTTKKISVNNILGASGTATLASATITGDLTVDTSTLKVDSTGNAVGIGSTSPTANTLTIGASRFILCSDSQSKFGDSGIINGGAADANTQIQFFGGKALIFSEGASNTKMTLNSTGLGVGVVPAGTGGCLQLKSGITFPATQVASSDANTLDDYEEGTWTPTIVGTTTAGVGVYSLQSGLYTKIGNRVFVEGYISWSAHTGTGNMRIGGLPFTINSSSFYSSGSIGDVNVIALTAGNILAILGVATSATIDMKQLPTGGGASSAVPIDVAANISFSLCYLV